MPGSTDRNENKGLIFDIQRYSIHDGPGIRTTVFMKGCPLRCFWCQNPESQEMKPEILLDRGRCVSCGACIAPCTAGANLLTKEGIAIRRNECTGCGACVEVCPKEARRLAGRYRSVGEVMKEILRDRIFYENSGGGVTLSGGEPLSQPDFVLEILRRSKEEGLHTAVDTCGFATPEILEKTVEYTDLFLYDIKCMDAARHLGATGKTNDLILANAKRIAGSKEMWVRVPLAPGFNDSEKEIRAIARFVKRELGLSKIDLQAYNELGEAKYGRLDKPGAHFDSQSDSALEALRGVVSSECPGEPS